MQNLQLTKRETQIAELIAWGAAKKDVANKLFISERTAENHTRHIYEKIGVTKVNELSAWWFCTHFNISMDLSPLKRQITALILLLIMIVNIACDNNYERNRRARRSEKRTDEVELIITD